MSRSSSSKTVPLGSTCWPSAVLRNLTVRARKGNAVWADSGDHLLEDCTFTSLNKDKGANASVFVVAPAHFLLRRCQVRGTVEGCGVIVRPALGQTWKTAMCSTTATRRRADGDGQMSLRKCRIHDNKRNGILIDDSKGVATLEDCELAGNAQSGVAAEQGTAKLRNCRLNRNLEHAVWVEKKGTATVEGCDLTGNLQGAWHIEPDCKVERKDNKE